MWSSTVGSTASQITNILTVCSAICSGTHQTIHQSSALLAFVRGIHRWPVDSPHKGPVTRKMAPFDDVIMWSVEQCSGIHGVSNHQHLDRLLSCLSRRPSKTTSKLCVTSLCEGNPPVTGGYLSQRASNAENISIWWRHHGCIYFHFSEEKCNISIHNNGSFCFLTCQKKILSKFLTHCSLVTTHGVKHFGQH